MTALALLLLAAGQDRPEIAPPDPDGSRRLVRSALTAYGLGVLNQRQDRLVEAARSLEEAVRLDPEAVPPRQLLIPLYAALGRPTDAARTAAAVVVMDPSQADTWRTLARLLHDLKRTGDAISVLNRCVAAPAMADRPADRIAAYHDLARLCAAVNAHPQAADACHKALSLLAEHRPILLVKSGEPAGLELERAELSELLSAASLAAGKFVNARDAALEARDGYRKGGAADRATAVAPKLAAAYAGLKDTAKAHALLDDYLTANRQDMAAFALKAKLLREAGDGPAALAVLTAAADREPELVPLRVLLGDECRRVGEPRRAEQAYRDVIDRKPDVAAYRGLFAILSGPGGNPTEILNLIDGKVKEARPEKDNDATEDAAARQRRESAAEHARAIAAALRREPAAAGLAITTAAREVGPRTRRLYERTHGTWYLLAGVAERAGQLESAEALFRQALSAADARQQFSISVALMRVLRAGRKREDLVQFCTAALKRQQTMKVVFHNQLASALVRLDRIEEAVKHADAAVAAAEAGDRLAAVLNRVGILAYAEQFRRAEDECLALLQDTKQPGDVQQIRHTLSNVYATARQFDKAEEQLRLLIELDPADAKAHNDLGYELADRGRQLDEAERLIRRALELDRAGKSDSLDDEGDRGAYLDSLGWVLFRKGRFAEARAVLEQAAATADAAADPVVWDHLGDACGRLDKPADASAAWERARELYRTEKRSVNDPRGAEVERKLKRLAARP